MGSSAKGIHPDVIVLDLALLDLDLRAVPVSLNEFAPHNCIQFHFNHVKLTEKIIDLSFVMVRDRVRGVVVFGKFLDGSFLWVGIAHGLQWHLRASDLDGSNGSTGVGDLLCR